MSSLLEQFEAERSGLFGVAYRLLGSVADAEDVVQEAYLRWVDDAGRDVRNPAAYLTTVVSRLAIDRLRSAQRQREEYVGPWLPEPILAEPGPDDAAVLAESLTIGFLTVLERLGPVERAVFVLHDVFATPFAEIAAIVDRSEANCRQIAHRARERVHAERVRYQPSASESTDLLEAFLSAVVEGDIERLEKMLAADVVHVSDGGADRHAARKPVVGKDRVARFFVNLAKRMPDGASVEMVTINAEPGIVVNIDGEPNAVFAVTIVDGLITNIWGVVNPDKITHLAAGA